MHLESGDEMPRSLRGPPGFRAEAAPRAAGRALGRSVAIANDLSAHTLLFFGSWPGSADRRR